MTVIDALEARTIQQHIQITHHNIKHFGANDLFDFIVSKKFVVDIGKREKKTREHEKTQCQIYVDVDICLTKALILI